MTELTVWIGNKNYSSWSLRGWLAAKMCGEPFEEIVIPLDQPGTKAAILASSPSGRVPAIRHRGLVVWDSLAIAEYLAETFPAAGLWPADVKARARARSISAEMHSGFSALRRNMPMNIRNRFSPPSFDGEVVEDVARIQKIWRECAAEYSGGGPFLFGKFSLADAFYAPVVTRFVTYGVDVSSEASRYMDAVLAHPFVKEWIDGAVKETWAMPEYDRLYAR